MSSALITTAKKHEYPILIVDKEGSIGEELARQLQEEFLVVFVSRKYLEELDNVVHVPFFKKFPTIPDNIYSHIFLIDENLEITKEILPAFLKKCKKDNSLLMLATTLSFVSEEFITNFLSSYDKSKIAIIGDIFKKDSIYNHQTLVNEYISQVKIHQKIKVPGDGTGETSPVYFDDVVSGIFEAVFGETKTDNIFYIFPKHKVTLLSLAHMFQKANPDLQIDFVKEYVVKQNNFIPPIEGNYILGEKYNLEERIKKINFSDININQVTKEIKLPKPKPEINFSIPLIIVFFIFILLLPLIFTLLFSFIGVGSLYSVKNDIEKGNFVSSKASIVLAKNSFNFALKSSDLLFEQARLIGQKDRVQDLINKIRFGKEASNASFSVVDSSEKIKSIIAGKSKDPSSDFSKSIVELKNALYIYSKEKETGLIPLSITSKLTDIITIVSSTIDFWPDILGFNEEKTYLVLFQNNMELRPGGGFIGSYAILTLSKGKITNFKIYDVYDADGQLKGHVEPPYPIRRYLPSAHWYLRDSNFNIDFSKGAIVSAVFLNLEMRQAVDGVIAVDLSFVKNLLSVVGPVKVSDYNQTVDTDNFFEVTQTNVEKDFFPGSTQKKDFLRSFYNALQLKISENKNISYLNLLQVLANSIYEKHVLFTFNNVNQQAAFSVNGWASALIDQRNKKDNRINDFIGINEANLGIDKVNYFITRSMSQVVNIDDKGEVSEDLTIAFKNTAQKTSWTGGLYKNYLRIVLPFGANITKIQIDGKDEKIVPAITDPTVYEKKNFIPPSGLEVQKEDQGKNTIYGFLISLQPQDLKTIRIQYALSEKLNFPRSDYIYSLKIFKQPGVDFYPYDFLLNYPSSLKIVNPHSGIKVSEEKAVLSTQISRDREVLINLSPK